MNDNMDEPRDIIDFAAKQMATTIREDQRRVGKTPLRGRPLDDNGSITFERSNMTRQMTVESRTEDKYGIIYELRTVNPLPHHDDRLTVVVKSGEDDPGWKVGQSVNVSIGEAA